MNHVIENNLAKTLKNMNNSDVSAKAIFEQFFKRQKDAQVSNVDRVAEVVGIDRSEVIRIFKLLDNNGCGHFIAGRRGGKSRMEWDKSIRSIANASKGNTQLVTKIDDAAIENDIEVSASQNTLKLIKHQINLRSDMAVEFLLPPDLTAREAERLAAFVKTIPFE